MKRGQIILLCVVAMFIASAAGALAWLKTQQRLGQPGIRFTPGSNGLAGSIELPDVPGFTASTNLPQDQITLAMLPKDTSFARKIYTNSAATQGKFISAEIQANVILQGADRTSIHKPDYCLPGQGWRIVDRSVVPISIDRPQPYELPVSKWTVRNVLQMQDGSKQELSGLYVFWFVADGRQTPDYGQRNRWLVRDMVFTGELGRWAYVSYFIWCAPGYEDAAFESIKQLIAASVPEFQLPPKNLGATVARQ